MAFGKPWPVEKCPNIRPVSAERLMDMFELVASSIPLRELIENRFPVKHSENDDGSEAE